MEAMSRDAVHHVGMLTELAGSLSQVRVSFSSQGLFLKGLFLKRGRLVETTFAASLCFALLPLNERNISSVVDWGKDPPSSRVN